MSVEEKSRSATRSQGPTTGNGKSKNEDGVDPSNMVGLSQARCRVVSNDNISWQMPKESQEPQKDQPFVLSTERQTSSIPKAGTENERWVYPSQQMFFNAMIRKVSACLPNVLGSTAAIHYPTTGCGFRAGNGRMSSSIQMTCSTLSLCTIVTTKRLGKKFSSGKHCTPSKTRSTIG